MTELSERFSRLSIFVFLLMLAIFILLSNYSVMKYKKATDFYKIPIGLQYLLKAYPEHLESASTNTLKWKDGTEMIFSDSIEKKDYETLLNFPDLQDQMSIIYPAGKNFRIPIPKNFDPGRIRYEPFF